MLSHFTRLLTLSTLTPAATAMVTTGINPSDLPDSSWRPDGSLLLDLGDPHLPYSLFTPFSPHNVERLGRLPLRFLGDPRLPRTRDHAWTDLLLIGSNPNFATLDLLGHLLPLTTTHPHRTAERIRWALHSLCQATVEAVAPPPTRLRRPPRRPIPPPAEAAVVLPADLVGTPHPSVQPRPMSAALPAPWVARDVQTRAPTPLHSGIPSTSSWTSHRPMATYGTLWSSLQRGPHHVALSGYTTSLSPNLRIGSLNTNGLTQPKLTELLWYMRLEQLDVFFLLDTRTPLRMGKFLGRQAREFMGPGSVAHVSPARPALESGANDRHALVGGQLLLLAPSWGCALKSTHTDPTGLGVLTEAVLGCTGGDILFLGVYFPCPPQTGIGPAVTSNK